MAGDSSVTAAPALAVLLIGAGSWELWGSPASSAVLQTARCDHHGRVEVDPSVCLKEDDKSRLTGTGGVFWGFTIYQRAFPKVWEPASPGTSSLCLAVGEQSSWDVWLVGLGGCGSCSCWKHLTLGLAALSLHSPGWEAER